MKKLEDMEKLDTRALERISADRRIEVPDTLKHDIGITARTLEVMAGADGTQAAGTGTGRRISIFSYAAAAAALVAVLLTLKPGTPKDTFDDPYLALAEFERTMNYIQDKTGAGLAFAENSVEPVIEKTINALK